MSTSSAKPCTICKVEKPLHEFGADKRAKGGAKSRCLECQRAINRSSYQRNIEARRASSMRWKNENRSQHNRHCGERAARIKERVFSAYGNVCSCCGETRVGFLTLEHIGGGGTAERKAGANTNQIYLRVIKSGFSDKFTLLCMNCNFATRLGRVCPHKSYPMDHDKRDLIPDLVKALEQAASCIEDLGRGEGGWAWEEVIQDIAAALAKVKQP